MTSTAIVGAQWGDEGKGKIVDFYVKRLGADCVVRYNGGNNAGHTVVVGEEVYKFHILPSGMTHPNVLNVVGNGAVVNPEVLVGEIESLEKRGFEIRGPNKEPSRGHSRGPEDGYVSLLVSDIAHVILPWHIALDGAREALRGDRKIGTTKRGIGPAYMDKAGRSEAIRMEDFMDPDVFEEKVEEIYPLKEWTLRSYALRLPAQIEEIMRMDAEVLKELVLKAYEVGIPVKKEELLRDASEWRRKLEPYVGDSVRVVNEFLDKDKTVIFEGAQGTSLGVDHGTYPHVTSSNPIAGGACPGAGVSPKLRIDRIIGVSKAYTTRVGGGGFPTELTGEIGEKIRQAGHEYGITTGRPRRVGWLDIPMLRHSHSINRFDGLAPTKLDVLGGLDKVKVCYAYKIDGKETDEFPTNRKVRERAIPLYETFKDWPDMKPKDWKSCAENGNLPTEIERYLDFITSEVRVPISLISFGPERDETIVLEEL